MPGKNLRMSDHDFELRAIPREYVKGLGLRV